MLAIGACAIAGLAVAGQPASSADAPAAEPRAVTPRGALPAEELQVVELFERVSASVAYVDTRRVVEGRGFFMEPRRQVVNGTGSAFIWDTDGHVVTNFHVIQDANSAQVVLSDGSTWPAELIGVAPDEDLALLKTQLATMQAAHEMHGGKLIGAMDPAAYGRMQAFMHKEGLIKKTVAPTSLLIDKPGFTEAINRFDRDAVIAAAKSCNGL